MTFADEINKLFSVPEDNRIIRTYKGADGTEVEEVIPASALKDYNRLLENMQKLGINDLKEMRRLIKHG